MVNFECLVDSNMDASKICSIFEVKRGSNIVQIKCMERIELMNIAFSVCPTPQ